ncbi:YagK/YfjJ domain-containing protein [Pseudomonas oryzihabitans]|uniref:YagK/YfjJ domain-containing protein n=1 Tax=Pseudomonas oryzihabitans TaxID=47885 RepID=UPI003D01D2CC
MSSRAKLLSEGCFKDDRGEVQVDTEWAARLALVFSIRPVLIEIGDTNEILFFAVKTSSGWEGMRCMPLGRKLLFALRADTLDSFEIFSDCNLNPYFESFRSIARKHAFFGWGGDLWTFRSTLTEGVVSGLNDFVQALRQEYASKEFKQKLSNYRRSGNKNLKSLRGYFLQLFEAHARILMVRVDFSYLKKCVEAGEALHERVQEDRDALIKHVRSGAFGRLLGAVWRLERGVKRGLHYHMLFCFDANVVQSDVLIGMLIGQYWQKEVTGGKGVYYNCNAYKEKYPSSFLGKMHYSDRAAQEGLDRFLKYITVEDDLLRLSLPHIRSMGKTGTTRRATPRRGRPRKG